ncbi:MAG: hypothetical protein MJH10_13660, partial [Epibacterium sp.]|nr:hypothetical protein [Epibacterium sp.]
ALNSGEWFFRFFILDCHFRHAIHLNPWPEFARPPLYFTSRAVEMLGDALFTACFLWHSKSCLFEL